MTKKSIKPKNNYVVYAYAREESDSIANKGTFYYIGKGRPDRPYSSNGRKHYTVPSDSSNIIILYSGLTEELAFKHEADLIKRYGRVNSDPNGILLNLTDGGQGTLGYRRNPGKIRIRREWVSAKRDWYHPDHGELKNLTISELSKKYPEHKLSLGALSLVTSGRLIQHKEWRLLENRGKQKQNYKPYDWYHPKHGIFLNKSVPEICELFTDQKLDPASMHRVCTKVHSFHKGWMLNKGEEENPTYIPKHNKYKPYDWHHPVHGEIIQKSLSELENLFPDQKLNRGSLCEIANGKRFQYKGWRLLKNKNIDYEKIKRNNSLKNKFNWYHSIYGEHLNLSITELIEKFPHLKLSQGCLSKVSNRKSKHHKGWSLLENKSESGQMYRSWDWYHPGYGTYLGKTVHELSALFPEQNLHIGCLNKVCLGINKKHKNWSLIK